MNISNKSGVIVIGGHVQGLGIARIFGRHNIPVILLDDTPFNITRHSKFCKAFKLYKNGYLLDYLLQLARTTTTFKNWLIIPTNDYHVKILSQNYTILSKYYKISTDRWDSVSICYNKIKTYKKAEEFGILHPKTFFPQNLEDVGKIQIDYPCIIKPAVMHEFYDKLKKKVFVCHSKSDLIRFYNKAIEIIPSEQVIVQEIIHGKSENQYSACFYIQNRKVISALTARRKRQHPLDFGNATTYAEIVNKKELQLTSELMLKEINYNGICEVEFKKNEIDNKYYFLEINPRTWKWHYIAHKANINFLLNQYNYLNSKPLINDNPTDTNICWQHMLTDLPTIIKLFFKGQYTKSKCKRKQFAVFDLRDIAPSIFEILLLPVFIFKR